MTWVSLVRDKLHLPLGPPFVQRMLLLPGCHPLDEAVSFTVQRPVQTTERVSEAAWDESRDFLGPYIKVG